MAKQAKKKNLNISQKIKFRKPSKSLSNLNYTSTFYKNNVLRFGEYGIQALKACFMHKGQIEACRVALRRLAKRSTGSRIWVRVKPSVIVTKRSLETRMGRGKGAPVGLVALISPGQILYEIKGVPNYRINWIYERMKKKIATPSCLVKLQK